MKKDRPKPNLRFAMIKKAVIRSAALLVIISLVIFVFVGYIWKAFSESEYFRVRDIITRAGDSLDISYLKGRNIFRLDIKRESGYISEFCPECKQVKIIRVLPDRLFVDFVRRRPKALVKLYKYYCTDEEGVLFAAKEQLLGSDLPVITGLETKIFGPKLGIKYNLQEMRLALDIIREAGGMRIFREYKIAKISVLSVNNTSIFIAMPSVIPAPSRPGQSRSEQYLEIKIGQEDIKDKIMILSGLLAQGKGGLVNIKYIDLRFKEPVIKLKNDK